MGFTDFRLKLRHFLRKYKKIIIVVLIIWGIIIVINYLLKNYNPPLEPSTTYEPHTSIMSTTSSTPKTMQDPIEKMIEEYVGYCNEGDYPKAFKMLSESCRKYEYNDNLDQFIEHVLIKMPTQKKYSIQDYSNIKQDGKNLYIYEIKYIDDIMATGLTNSTYDYSLEKMAFYKDNKGNIQMSTGNYIYNTDIKSISENEYLKIDVIDKLVNYSVEKYNVKFTNRSDYTIVIADNFENNEILLNLPNETRSRTELTNIVLEPQESVTKSFIFSKFVDDGDTSQSLEFGAIRVMEKYSGTNVEDNVKQSEIDNAISKFSMEVSVK